jgi:hypothetical protein
MQTCTVCIVNRTVILCIVFNLHFLFSEIPQLKQLFFRKLCFNEECVDR